MAKKALYKKAGSKCGRPKRDPQLEHKLFGGGYLNFYYSLNSDLLVLLTERMVCSCLFGS